MVLAHGIGTSAKALKELGSTLVADGYSVLRYDYYGHGYSKFGQNMWTKYTPDVFVDQLEDLLDHVMEETKEDVVALAGHSTGGLVGIAANHRWGAMMDGGKVRRAVLPKLVLINPSLYAKKPLVARIADAIPETMRFIFKKVSFTRKLIADGYMDAGKVAFARDPATQEYLYPDAKKAKEDSDSRLLGLVQGVEGHPFLLAGIVGINNDILRGDLLPHHRENLIEVLRRTGEDQKTDAVIIWGDLDCSVPYEENHEEVRGWCKEYDNLSLSTLERVGHEAPFENTPALAEKVLAFMNA